jgi:hypothetical protein
MIESNKRVSIDNRGVGAHLTAIPVDFGRYLINPWVKPAASNMNAILPLSLAHLAAQPFPPS